MIPTTTPVIAICHLLHLALKLVDLLRAVAELGRPDGPAHVIRAQVYPPGCTV
jgi:hypothetical protein